MRGGLKVRLVVLALTGALVALAFGAAPAAADDASVFAAWTSRDADAERLVERVHRTRRLAVRTDGRRIRPALRAIRALRSVAEDVNDAVAAEEPSSEPGARAKEYALLTFIYVRRSLITMRRELRAAHAGRFRRANRLARRTNRLLRRWTRNARRANDAFREAGVLEG